MATATETREHPILFKGHLVRAILEGRKTVTRRVVKPQHWKPRRPVTGPFWGSPGYPRAANGEWGIYLNRPGGGPYLHLGHCPYGQPGDRLWVRESHYRPEAKTSRCVQYFDGIEKTVTAGGVTMWGKASDLERYIGLGRVTKESIEANRGKLRPSIHMPRWASRIDLEVTAVRVERIQDITTEQIIAEGYSTTLREAAACADLALQFERSWDAINGPRGFGWKANPWVWVIEFRKVAG